MRCADLDQGAEADAGAPPRGRLPLFPLLQEFGPEWEEPALYRFDGVDAAASRDQEGTLPAGRLAQPRQIARAVHIGLLERARRQVEEAGDPDKIGLAQVDESGDFAAAGTTLLTLESDALHYSQTTGRAAGLSSVILKIRKPRNCLDAAAGRLSDRLSGRILD